MKVTAIRAGIRRDERAALLDITTTESLVTLMQSVGAQDDPTLRRRLSTVLMQLDAVHGLRNGIVPCQPEVVVAAECRALAEAGEFVTEVLGAALLADAGNPHRAKMLPLVHARDALDARAQRAVENAAADVVGHVIERSEIIEASRTGSFSASKKSAVLISRRAQEAYFAGFSLSGTALPATVGLGEETSVLAAVEQTGSWNLAAMQTHAQRADVGWTITGDKWFVPENDSAAAILVVATTTDGPSLFRVERGAPRLEVTPMTTLPGGRPLSQMTFRHTPATLIKEGKDGIRVLRDVVAEASTTLAGEQMGLIDRALKEISDLPPSCSDDESWRRYTLDVAELEVLRSGAMALWYRITHEEAESNTEPRRAVSEFTHVACSHALNRVALHLTTITSGIDCTTAKSIRTRAHETSLLLGAPAAASDRLLDRLGV